MRRLVTVLTALLLATAAAAGAGDDIKWKRSKKLKTILPTSEFDEFGSDIERMESKYMLDWTPYINRDIDFILATYYGWEVIAVTTNNDLKRNPILKEELAGVTENAREDFKTQVLFLVKMRFNNGEFFDATGEDYWSFHCLTTTGKTEPEKVDKDSYKKPINVVIGVGSPSYNPYGPDYRWYREYKVYFDKAALGSEPEARKLVIVGGDIKRGFEWRFKEE